MKRFFKGCLVSFLIFISVVTVAFYLRGKSLNTIEISTHGHTLEPVWFFDNGEIAIIDSSRNTLITGVMGFQLVGDIIYGWLTPYSRGHFMIFLKENKVEVFDSKDSLGDLDKKLLSLGMERSNMGKEVTFWDIHKEGIGSVSEYLAKHPEKSR